MEPPTYVIVAWTTIRIPLSIPIEKRKAKAQRDFLSLMSCHAPDDTPGFLRAVYGRVKEDLETVWLLTAWGTHETLDAFEATEAYEEQKMALSKLSTISPDTHRCHIDGHFWNCLAEHTGVTDVYFPFTISDTDREKAEHIRGMVYFTAPWRSAQTAYITRGNRGWVQGPTNLEGKEVAALRFLDYWKSPETEADFKTSQGVMIDERFVGVRDYFKEQLRDAGMISMRELHCDFLEIPVFFIDGKPPPESDDDSDEAI